MRESSNASKPHSYGESFLGDPDGAGPGNPADGEQRETQHRGQAHKDQDRQVLSQHHQRR
jgi:hypothetical protein